MQLSFPVIHSVDVLLVGGTARACALALRLRAAGLTVFAVTPWSYFADDFCARLDLRPPEAGEEEELFRGNRFAGRETLPPLTLKHRVERRFADAGIGYLFQTHPVRWLRDAAGRPAGLAVAGRGGFMGIAARVVLDATPRQLAARLAGAPCAPFVPGEYPVSLRALGAAATDGNQVEEMPYPVRDGARAWPLFKVTRRVRLEGVTPRDFARADVLIRNAAWHPDTLMLADMIDLDPGDGVLPSFVPSPACPVVLADRADAAAVTGLLENCRPGPAVGTAAAAAAGRDAASVRRDVPFRYRDRPQVSLDLDTLPGTETAQVLVVGGGTAGAPAAIAAARDGARVACVENLSVLGGISTAGMIGVYCFGNRVGFTAEIDRGTTAMGAGRPTYPAAGPRHNIRWKAAWFLREAAAAGADVYLNTLMVAALTRDRDGTPGAAGAVFAGPWGVTAVTAGACVDATGNCDLAAAAGAETFPLVDGEPAVQGAGLSPVLLGQDYVNSDFAFMCDSDTADATRAYTMAHAKFQGFFDSAPVMETRERRRVVGELTLQPQDFYANRTYRDTVDVASSNFDTHGFTVHPLFLLQPADHTAHSARVPFRAMLPRGLAGVVVTGLGMSAHRDCMPLIRMQPDVHNQGYAAGTAAAMAARDGRPVNAIDIRELQRRLVDRGILPPETLEETDGIGGAAPGETHYELARIFLDPAAALPEIRERFARAPTARDAEILAFLGDGRGRETLARELRSTPWDQGWNYTGMDQFGMSSSPVDCLLFALSRTEGDADAVLGKLRELGPDAEFSHVRAVALALLAHPDPRAAAALTGLLSAYGVAGHAVRSLRDCFTANREEWNDTETRNMQLRELYLAKALAACAPESELARTVLAAYRDSLDAYYALFAGADVPAAR